MDIGAVHGGLSNRAPRQDTDQTARPERNELEARRQLADAADTARQSNSPDDVRHDRVIQAQERMDRAFYNQGDIRQVLVDKLAASHLIESDSDDDDHANQRLEQIKQQIRRGDYLNNDIVTGLADRLVDSWSDEPL